ncbi:protein big brother-like [Rhopalosiphum maidis]|uniref:protein big brother-like n=1 Tax=Rhopalosiphum maidis TaxID=43146 RepID=UPI000EFF8C54|nr:protein big brother-like [Rhopalosiphum maidis]XP_060844668.1 protein big brother-like [Rhopalosiphum padi]
MLMMNDLGSMAAGMMPFDPMCGSLYEQQPPKPRFIFKMPRVVPDQKNKFETDELFRRLSRESDVRYTGYRDRPHEERQSRFQIGCREGHVDIAFTATGTNLQLMFTPSMPIPPYHQSTNGTCNFEKERGMVHILSHFIMNGVCVRWKGRIDLDKLDGIGCLEFDEERAMIENRMLQEQIERYNDRIREYQDKPRAYRHQERGVTDSDLDVKRRLNY